jgi:hypothetical protein
MLIRVLSLDLERTLISDAYNREPRPGLRDFLLFCCDRFERIVLFTSVGRANAFAALQECAESGDVPQAFLEKVEYVVWEGKYKDLRFVANASVSEILLVDDDGGWLRPDQQEQWIGIAEYDPYLVKGEDREFDRVRRVLEDKIEQGT